jgi:putative endopeptidase
MNLSSSSVPRFTTRFGRGVILGLILLSSTFGLSAQALSSGRTLGIDVTGMDRSVRPQDDFFRFVNGSWADRTPIPSDLSSYGTFAILRDEAAAAVREIVEGAVTEKAAAGTMTQKVGGFYSSFMDTARIESLGVQPIARELAAVNAIASVADLPAAFLHAAASGVTVPLAIGVGQDPKDSNQYAVSISQSGLNMPDRDYYLRPDDKFAGIRKAYADYIAQLLTFAGQRDPRGAADRILAFETGLAEKQWDRARNRDRNATYNRMTLPVLEALAPHFNWPAYFSSALKGGSVGDRVKDAIVRQPDYLKALDAALAATPLSTWKEYLTFSWLNAYSEYLPTTFVNAQFQFFGGVIGGREENRPRWKRGVSAVEAAVGEPVGRLYIDKHFKSDAKTRVDALVRNLLAAFKVGIDELEWMSPATKAQAQAKLAKYSLKIGYPDQWRDYEGLQVSDNDLVGNVMRSQQFDHAEMWGRLGKPVERWRWGMFPQTVNAQYSSTNNEITFPAGILQPPFFNVDADDAVNYGAIGAVIGHEISHGFDDQGRKSDGDGNLRDWWTSEDARAFEARATRLGAQYESYTPLPGMKINGRQTMGENIGDLSGIAVALRAYHISLQGRPAPVIDGFTGDQRFFMGYAQIWRFKERDAALRNQLLTDVHSPGMFRAFIPLTNIDAFYSAFNVQPGDKLYRAPADRVKIW